VHGIVGLFAPIRDYADAWLRPSARRDALAAKGRLLAVMSHDRTGGSADAAEEAANIAVGKRA